MKLRQLVEALIPTLLDDLEGYNDYELSLIAIKQPSQEQLATSIVYIHGSNDEYTVTSSEVQVLERP